MLRDNSTPTVQPNEQSKNMHNYSVFSYSVNQLQLCSNMYTTEIIGYIAQLYNWLYMLSY